LANAEALLCVAGDAGISFAHCTGMTTGLADAFSRHPHDLTPRIPGKRVKSPSSCKHAPVKVAPGL